MTRAFVPLVLVCSALFSVWAQPPESQGCSVGPQFEPALGSNLKAEVTFGMSRCDRAELIESIGRQTRIPIGVVLGKDPDLLSKTRRTYRVFDLSMKSALLEAVTGTGYTVSESDAGFLLTAGVLLGKIWGYLKYHHPQVTSGQVQWDYELFRILPAILAAPDRAAAQSSLLHWLGGLGVLPSCNPRDTQRSKVRTSFRFSAGPCLETCFEVKDGNVSGSPTRS